MEDAATDSAVDADDSPDALIGDDASAPDGGVPEASVPDASVMIPDGAMECRGYLECPAADAPSCESGVLTTPEAVCSGGRCGVVSSSSACPAPSGQCRGLNYVTFSATCANETTCGDAQETLETCTGKAAECANGELTEYGATCSTESGCGLDSRTRACPSKPNFCDGLELHSFTPACASAGACADQPTESVSTCTPPASTCSAGVATTYLALCSATTGCGSASKTASCPDEDSFCTNAAQPELVTYEPACANGSSCGTATESRQTCTAPASSCSGTVWTQRTPTCNAAQESCGVKTTTVDCSNQESCSVESLSGQPGCRMVLKTAICDPNTGCSLVDDAIDCPGKKCDCGTRACVQ